MAVSEIFSSLTKVYKRRIEVQKVIMSIAFAIKNNGCIPTDLEHEPHEDNKIRVPRQAVDEDDKGKLEIDCKMGETGQYCASRSEFLKSDHGQLINFSFNCRKNNKETRCVEQAGANGYGLSNVAHLRINCNKEVSGGSRCNSLINFSNPAPNRTSVDPERTRFLIHCSQFGFPNLNCSGKHLMAPKLDIKRGMAGFDMSRGEIDRNDIMTCVRTPKSALVVHMNLPGLKYAAKAHLMTIHDVMEDFMSQNITLMLKQHSNRAHLCLFLKIIHHLN